MEYHKNDGHKKRVEQNGHHCAKDRGVPDPPCGEDIPDKKGNVGKLKNAVLMVNLPVFIQVVDDK
jgi:hypothetical protein